jgi:hypothetical protein
MPGGAAIKGSPVLLYDTHASQSKIMTKGNHTGERASRNKSPIIEEVATMARTIKEVEKTENSVSEENNETDESELAKQLPISVGDPMEAESLTIDQSHMEDFANAEEEESSDVKFGKPPKGIYITVRAETTKPWKDRGLFFLLEIAGRDPFIVAPSIAKKKADEDVIRPVLIVRYVTMAGEEGLWLLKLDKPDAKSNPYNKTALTALKAAEGGWVRLRVAKGQHRHTISPTTFEECPPKFSNRTFFEMIDTKFVDQIIRSLDHEVWDALDRGSDK